ncbi:MAG: AAA family ATPase [Pyrinomonadaceae bacterium]
MEAFEAFKEIAPCLTHPLVLIGFVLLPFFSVDIKSQTEKAERFFKWLAEVWRGKNWLTIFSLLVVVFGLIFNPATIPKILSSFTPDLTLPPWYTSVFWGVISLLFIAALVVAVRSKARELEAPTPVFERSAIKGLRSYAFEDADLFARLQRERDLRKCLDAITSPEFRFGIVQGESGCGKTSFLQAGLWPRLAEQKAPHRAIYVKLTDQDPLDSIRQALREQAQLPQEKVEKADILALLEHLLQAETKTVVLLLDQFEQFFVHRKREEQRKAFVQALATWYRRIPPLPVKILIGLRDDFFGSLISEFQEAMGFSLGEHDSFRLKKFAPEQAAGILKVIAETENITIDLGFVQRMSDQELAREDGLVSPVDIQILAWMIEGQKTTEERAFNRTAFQRLGGVEGLLDRFLKQLLDKRETEARRQDTLKVMLALTDLERDARAVLSLMKLQQRLSGTVAANEVVEAVAWLSRWDVRLITPIQRKGAQGYELSHERLIPALRRLAGKTLTLADQANRLLDLRVNEWLRNNCSTRYLFSRRELRLIRTQMPYLVWEARKSQKEALLAQSQRRLCFRQGGASLVMLLFIGLGAAWNSNLGQMWLAKRELMNLRAGIQEPYALSSIAELDAAEGRWEQALEAVNKITDPFQQRFALGAIADRASGIADGERLRTLWQEILRVAVGIKDPVEKARALSEIGRAAQRLDKENLGAVRAKMLEVVAGIKEAEAQASAWGQLARSALRQNIVDNDKAHELWAWTIEVAEKIEASDAQSGALSAIAIAAADFAVNKPDPKLWAQALQVAQRLQDNEAKSDLVSDMASAFAHAIDAGAGTIRWAQMVDLAQGIGESDAKARALSTVASQMAAIANVRNDSALWSSALQVVDDISEPMHQGRTLAEIGGNAAGHYYIGLFTTGIWTHVADRERVDTLFARAYEIADAITDPKVKASARKAIDEVKDEETETKRFLEDANAPYPLPGDLRSGH